jgi:hypothetical protein
MYDMVISIFGVVMVMDVDGDGGTPFHGVPRGIFKFEIFTSSWNPVISASDTVKYGVF